ncbi:MAG: hypothetical protein ACRDCW_13995, partial [Sarcina sp.]
QSHTMLNKSKGNNLPRVIQDISVHGQNKDFNLSSIKFLDSKIIDENGNKFITTKIQNDSDRKIMGIKYTYDLDGQAIVVETNEVLASGATSDLIKVSIRKNTSLKNSKLVKVDVKFLDAKNEVSNLEFAKSI